MRKPHATMGGLLLSSPNSPSFHVAFTKNFKNKLRPEDRLASYNKKLTENQAADLTRVKAFTKLQLQLQQVLNAPFSS